MNSKNYLTSLCGDEEKKITTKKYEKKMFFDTGYFTKWAKKNFLKFVWIGNCLSKATEGV